MTNTKNEQIIQLKEDIQRLVSQYHATDVDEAVLKNLTQTAKDRHSRTELIECASLSEVLEKVQSMVLQGWTFKTRECLAIVFSHTGFTKISMIKPEDILDRELSEVAQRVEQEYVSSVELGKKEIINQIEGRSLDLAKAELDLKNEIKIQADFEKSIAKIHKELGLDKLSVSSEEAVSTVCAE